jgi:hypothetical protein
MLTFVTYVFTTYFVTAITCLIGQRNFFKISHKLFSVCSFVKYHERTTFSNAVIALHVGLFVAYVFRYSMQWELTQCRIGMLHMFISSLVCETVTSFAAVQFLYFVLILR